MAATLKALNLVEGAGAEWSLDGWTLRGMALVKGVTAAGLGGLKEACEVAGMPRPGSAHPQDGDLTLYSLAPQALGAGNVKVALAYRAQMGGVALGKPNISTGSRVQSEETWTDLGGANITVSWTPPGKATQVQHGSVHVMRPHRTWVMTRLETSDPGPKSTQYAGAVNVQGGFAPGGADQDAGTWLCTTLDGRSSDGGRTYQVTYEFEEKTDGWDPMAVYLDPETGRPPDPETWEANTVNVVTEYPKVNFDNLDLVSGDPLASMIDWGSWIGGGT